MENIMKLGFKTYGTKHLDYIREKGELDIIVI